MIVRLLVEKAGVAPDPTTVGEIFRTEPLPVDEVFTCVAALVTSNVSVAACARTRVPVKFDWENVGAEPPYSVEKMTESATEYPWAGAVMTPGDAELTVHGRQSKLPRKSQTRRFPDVDASYSPQAITVPHPAVAVGNVIASALLFELGPVPDAAFHVAPEVDTRAYEPPLTSVKPLPASVPTAVNRAAYAVGRDGMAVLPTQKSKLCFAA